MKKIIVGLIVLLIVLLFVVSINPKCQPAKTDQMVNNEGGGYMTNGVPYEYIKYMSTGGVADSQYTSLYGNGVRYVGENNVFLEEGNSFIGTHPGILAVVSRAEYEKYVEGFLRATGYEGTHPGALIGRCSNGDVKCNLALNYWLNF